MSLGDIDSLDIYDAVELIEKYNDVKRSREIFKLQMFGYIEEAERRINEKAVKDFEKDRHVYEREYEWEHKPFVDKILKERQK